MCVWGGGGGGDDRFILLNYFYTLAVDTCDYVWSIGESVHHVYIIYMPIL